MLPGDATSRACDRAWPEAQAGPMARSTVTTGDARSACLADLCYLWRRKRNSPTAFARRKGTSGRRLQGNEN